MTQNIGTTSGTMKMDPAGIRLPIVQAIKRIHWKDWPRWFVLAAGALLLFSGLTSLSSLPWKAGVFDLDDPVLGIPLRNAALVATVLELAVAAVCLFTRKTLLASGLVGWLALNFIVYRVGLWTMGWHHPYTSVFWLTDGFGFSPRMADWIQAAITAYLLAGSSMVICKLQGRMGGRLKMSCPSCGGHVKFAFQNVGQQIPCPHCKTTITLRKPDEILKMSCFFCKEHIEFPAHALGQKMPCPHCKMDITLKLIETNAAQ